MERFINKTVVVTGASRSIGKAIAKRIAEEKANVIDKPLYDANGGKMKS